MQKTLYILRHAKAESGAEDHERPLSEVGLKEAHTMGEYLSEQDIRFEKVFCSSSLRTRQTWEQIDPWYKQLIIIDYTDALYLASVEDMLKMLSDLPASVENALLIGHNPGLQELAIRLVREGEEKKIQKLGTHFVPCSFAEITLETEWKNVSRAHGTLARFITPDSLK